LIDSLLRLFKNSELITFSLVFAAESLANLWFQPAVRGVNLSTDTDADMLRIPDGLSRKSLPDRRRAAVFTQHTPESPLHLHLHLQSSTFMLNLRFPEGKRERNGAAGLVGTVSD
jgi:hypothetical protein